VPLQTKLTGIEVT